MMNPVKAYKKKKKQKKIEKVVDGICTVLVEVANVIENEQAFNQCRVAVDPNPQPNVIVPQQGLTAKFVIGPDEDGEQISKTVADCLEAQRASIIAQHGENARVQTYISTSVTCKPIIEVEVNPS